MTTTDTKDPFALARGDAELFALFAEHKRAYELVRNAEEDDEAQKFCDEACKLEEQIGAIRPVTIAGALKMLERSIELSRGFEFSTDHPMFKQAMAGLRAAYSQQRGEGTENHVDAELLAAHRRLNALLSQYPGVVKGGMGQLTDAARAEIDFINSTPTTTLLGAAIKLSALAALDYCIECEDEHESLRQVTEFIAREAGLP